MEDPHPQYQVDSSLEVSLDNDNRNNLGRHTSIESDDSFDYTFQTMKQQQQLSSTDICNRGMSKRRRVNLLIDQCETVRFPFKKKLILANMGLVPHDLPLEDLNALGPTLVKLSLARNRLMAIPDTIVLRLTGLRTLDLSQCELCTLPPKWNLPQLRRLNLSHNRLTEFPDEVSSLISPSLFFYFCKNRHLTLYY
jgi:Leucine-rich repeat (LRR) protein